MNPKRKFKELLTKFKKWREDESDFIGLFVKVLNFLGLWPETINKYGLPSPLGKSLTLVWLFVLCPIFIVIGYSSSYKNHTNGDAILIVLEPSLVGGTILVFLIYAAILRFNGHRFVDALKALELMLECGRKLEEHPKDILRKTKKFAELCVLYYLLGTLIFGLSAGGNIVMMFVTKKFLFKAWLPYDIHSSPYFELSTALINGTVVTGFHMILLVNGFMLLHLALVIGNFKLLNYNLTRLNLQTSDYDPTERTEVEPCHRTVTKSHLRQREQLFILKQLAIAEAEHRLKICAEHHQSIINLVTKFHAAFSPILLNQFFLTVAPTIVSIVLLTGTNEFNLKLHIVYALPLAAVLCNQGLCCWLGQKVIVEVMKMSYSTFMSLRELHENILNKDLQRN